MKKSPKLTEEQKHTLNIFIKKGGSSGREVRRAQAILLINEDVDVSAITAVTGFKRRQIFELRRYFLERGLVAVKDNRKGKPKELLTKKQREEVIEVIKTKKPKDLDMYYRNYDYWTTGVLGDWIEKKYEVTYKSKTSHYLLFRKARFTYHKPGRVYKEHSTEEIQAWRGRTRPRVKELWQEQEKDTVIVAGDEIILTTETTTQKVWLPEGEYPRIECSTGGRRRRSVYGFLNIRNGSEHAWKREHQNMHVTKEVLQELRRLYPRQKIALLWDRAGWHLGSVVQEFLKQDGNIEIIHFPRYAPQENPQEHVWKNGRSMCIHNKFIEDIDGATDEFVAYLNTTKFPYELLGFSALL